MCPPMGVTLGFIILLDRSQILADVGTHIRKTRDRERESGERERKREKERERARQRERRERKLREKVEREREKERETTTTTPRTPLRHPTRNKNSRVGLQGGSWRDAVAAGAFF